MIKKFFARSISRPSATPAIFILPAPSWIWVPILLAVFAVGCGESPGGSEYSGDTTPPVTTVDTATGDVAKGDLITFTCTDNSSGCKETWLSAVESGDPVQYAKVYDIDASGSKTSFTVEISGTHTIGTDYDYKFYSVDRVSNTESVKARVYSIVP